jgi:hypothetical protein
MIPSEVISLYLVGSGLIPRSRPTLLTTWSVVCLVGVVVARAFGTRDPRRGLPPQWPVVALSSGAFIVWLYAIGGPFVHFPSIYDPIVGSLLVLAWTFFIPYIYDPQCDLFEGFNRRRRAIKLPPHAKPTAPTPIQQTVAKPPPMPDQPAQTPAQPAAPKGQARTNPG